MPVEGEHRPEDALDRLGEQLRRTQEAAERLAGEARSSAESSRERPPPSGYAVPGQSPPRSGGTGSEFDALVRLLEAARGIFPPELQAQLTELVRELLLLVRALIDWYLERLDRSRAAPEEVEDIPIS